MQEGRDEGGAVGLFFGARLVGCFCRTDIGGNVKRHKYPLALLGAGDNPGGPGQGIQSIPVPSAAAG